LLQAIFPNEISKPTRGLFVAASQTENETADIGSTEQVSPLGGKVKEGDFYEPFADWLKDDLDEVTAVAPLGDAGLKSKWGTPDVVGTYKPLASNLIKFPIEIVAAEIKIDPQAPVVAFGQSVAYRLFATKTYIAMPHDPLRRQICRDGAFVGCPMTFRFVLRHTQSAISINSWRNSSL